MKKINLGSGAPSQSGDIQGLTVQAIATKDATQQCSKTALLKVSNWRKAGLVVECPTTDPKVVGSNPGSAEIGLHVFHKPP